MHLNQINCEASVGKIFIRMLVNISDSMRYCFLVASTLAFLLLNFAGATIIGTATIRAPAVIVTNNTGSLTIINLTVSSGTGSVGVVGPTEIGNSTVQSADIAANYATEYLSDQIPELQFHVLHSRCRRECFGP